MNTIYRITPKQNIFTPLPNLGRLPGNRKTGFNVKNKENLAFKSYSSESPGQNGRKSVVDALTEKILITFFNRDDAKKLKHLKKEVARFDRIQNQIQQEQEQGTRLDQIF